ncbi:glycosyltransferase family 8 protein [Streptomyces sp. NPDC050560]|uniref:glycosyltransferase family 8 protein n=1 Tax=Streptomyces sp. NPDC050560 TaxID=3365630 RepID=UPI0037A32C43
MFAIGMCIDERYLLPSLVALTSLAEHLPRAERREAAVRILTLDLSRKSVETLAAVSRRCGFRSFDVRWQAPLAESVMADGGYISITTYLRFGFTPGFLGRPYLIYVDADVLVQGDISAPLHELPPYQVGAVRDEFNPAVGRCPALPGVAERWPHLVGRPYFNAGMLWAPVGMLGHMRSGVRTALTKGRLYILHNDQCALNLWLLASGAVHSVAPIFNRFELGRFLERSDWVRRVVPHPLHDRDAHALHFVGELKPWLRSCPNTPEVVAYRAHLRRTIRHLGRTGDHIVPEGS